MILTKAMIINLQNQINRAYWKNETDCGADFEFDSCFNNCKHFKQCRDIKELSDLLKEEK